MSKYFKILFVSLLLFVASNNLRVYSQNIKDSLRFSLILSTTEYNKADILLKIAKEDIKLRNYVEASENINKALKIANSNNIKSFKAECYYLLGKIAFLKEDIENAINNFTRSVNIYENLKDPEKLIIVNSDIGDVYKYLGAYSKAADYYKNAYEIADSINNFDSKITYLEKTAEAYYIQGEFLKAEIYFLKLYEELKQNPKSDFDDIKVFYKLSETYKKLDEYDKALSYNLKIYAIYAELKDTTAMSVVSNNIGYLYFHLSNYESALQSFKTSLEFGLNTNMNDEEYAKLYANIGICYQNLGDFDNTNIYLKLALRFLKNSDNYLDIARLENITANIFHKDEDLYNAELFSRNSIESAKKSEDKDLLQICYYSYSQIIRDGNDYIAALEYYEKHLSLKDSLLFEQRINEQELNQKIYNLEKTEKELKLKLADEEVKDLALTQLRLEAEKREREMDLLKSEKELEQSEKDRLQQSLELSKQRHEAEIRERELKQLEQDKAIQDLVLKQKEAEEKEREKEIALLESEKERQQLELEKQAEAKKRAQWMVALFAVIVVLILIGLIITKKKNTILANQKIEIEEKNIVLENKNEEILTQSERIIVQKDLIEKKNEEITDSIHYASRIQNAVLPSVQVLDNYLSEYFIFFKPKDIVSGDFYWAAEKNDKLVVTAADCTGHGVPGAFMSMLGMSFLNEIVLKEEILDADKILNQLRFEVIKSLKQSGKDDEAKDGMDMALCVIDKKNMNMQFAGANNPMYFIKNGELEKIKPDRMPISIHFRSDANFTKQEFGLKTSDTIYIFSDGFADQFGGSDGRKLKYKPFQDLLFNMHTEPMDKQKRKLDKFFDEWRGDLEQIDDVLIIGMRI